MGQIFILQVMRETHEIFVKKPDMNVVFYVYIL